MNKVPIWGRIKAMEEDPKVESWLLQPTVLLYGPKGYFHENYISGKRFTSEQEIHEFVMALKKTGKTQQPILGYRIDYQAWVSKEVSLI
jgi:hypothetical protein